MAATRFSDSATKTVDLSKSRPKYTATSGFANTLQVWPRWIFTRVFRITINFTTFRTISGTFESTSGFWSVLPGYRFRFGAPGFVIESILAVHLRYGDHAGQNKAKKERPGGSRGQTGSKNIATTRFSDSGTPNFDFSKSRPKYTTTSGFAKCTSPLTTTTFYTSFSNYGQFNDISDHFWHFCKYFRFPNCISGPQI